MKQQSTWEVGLQILLPALGILFLASLAHAGEDARVLPAGRSRFSFVYAQTSGITQQFDGQGNKVDITAPYNVDLSAQKLQSASSDLSALINTLNTTNVRYNAKTNLIERSNGTNDNLPLIGDAIDRGFLNVSAQAYRQEFNMAFMRGITDHLSVGISLPIIKTEVYTSHAITGTNVAASISSQLGAGSNYSGAIQKALSTIANSTDGTLQGLLTAKGYDPFVDYNGSGLGDAVLGGRYNYVDAKTRGGEILSSFQLGVTAPTGRVHLPQELTTPSNGNGNWTLGAANIFNYIPTHWLTLSNGLHYTKQFADNRIMRIRANSGDIVPGPEDQELVHEQQGDKYWFTLGTTFHLHKSFDLDFGYEWFWKGYDNYSGARPIDYTYETIDSNQYMETASVGISYSTIPAFMKKDFPLPISVGLNVYVPTTGKNELIAPYATAELDLFF